MNKASDLKQMSYRDSQSNIELFSGLLRARKQFGASKTALIDGDERKLTYNDLVRAAFALGAALKKGTKAGETIGIMLPTGAAAIIGFMLFSLMGAFQP